MTNNHVLQRILHALNFDLEQALEVFALAGNSLSLARLKLLLMDENDVYRKPCSAKDLSEFLEGLILKLRGPKEGESSAPKMQSSITNNLVLQKLRIALNLKEEGMLEVFYLGDVELNKNELGSLFRKPGNKHYRACSDELLEHFFDGLTIKLKAPM